MSVGIAMQPPPLKPRSPQKAARRLTLDHGLPRSYSHPSLSRLVGAGIEGVGALHAL